ncbi:MAG: SIR2 family protein [Candidatus Cybelea sp.]
MLEIVGVIARRIVAGDLVPFIGAGVSRDLLGGIDWPAIAQAMAAELDIPLESDYPAIAQRYEDRFGRETLLALLAERLKVEAWDDIKGYGHLALMQLRFPAYYTTNLDNAVERCYAAANLPLQVIVEPADLKKSALGVPAYYKFHGDAQTGRGVVFTTNDYQARSGDANHFMHVLLRADLLQRSLFFIGYSLGDPYVVEILTSMQRLYAEAMKEGFLVAYGCSSPAFLAQVRDMGLTVVELIELYPDCSDSDALVMFLDQLSAEIVGLDVKNDLEGSFTKSIPLPVLNDVALKAIENKSPSLSVEEAAEAFSTTCGMHKIPSQFEERVAKIYADVCARPSTAKEAEAVAGAIFNVVGCSPKFYCTVYSAGFSLYRFDSHFLLLPIKEGIKDMPETNCMLIGSAVIFMAEKGIEITDAFRSWVSRVQWGCEVLDGVPPQIVAPMRQAFADLFRGSVLENPLERDARQSGFKPFTFQDLTKMAWDSWPKQPRSHGG